MTNPSRPLDRMLRRAGRIPALSIISPLLFVGGATTLARSPPAAWAGPLLLAAVPHDVAPLRMTNPSRPLDRMLRRAGRIAALSIISPLRFFGGATTLAQSPQGAPADLLIRNGRVIDGTGAAART